MHVIISSMLECRQRVQQVAHQWRQIKLLHEQKISITHKQHDKTYSFNLTVHLEIILILVLTRFLLRHDITLSATKSLRIFTDRELMGDNEFVAYDKIDLRNANELLKIMETQQRQSYKIGIINLVRYRNLYITCPTLSNYSTLSPNGNSNAF